MEILSLTSDQPGSGASPPTLTLTANADGNADANDDASQAHCPPPSVEDNCCCRGRRVLAVTVLARLGIIDFQHGSAFTGWAGTTSGG